MKRDTKPKTDITLPVAIVAAVIIWFTFGVGAGPWLVILAIGAAIFWPSKPRCRCRGRCDCD